MQRKGYKMKKMLTWVAALVAAFQVGLAAQAAVTADTGWYDAEKDAFELTSEDQFAGFAQLVNAGTSFDGKTVVLGADLTFGEDEVRSSAMFSKVFDGTFDGNGKTIKGLKFSGSGNYLCLFYSLGGTIKNLILDTVTLSGSINWTGGLVGLVQKGATVTGVTVNNLTVEGASVQNFGGIASYVYAGGEVSGCKVNNMKVNENTVSTTLKSIGGIAGQNFGAVSDCEVDGLTVTTSDVATFTTTASIGGVAGVTSGNIKSSVVNNVKIALYEVKQSGGLVGSVNGVVAIENCNVNGVDFDGMFGGNETTSSRANTIYCVGGLIGLVNKDATTTVKGCEVTNVDINSAGNVKGAGGLVGAGMAGLTVEDITVAGVKIHGENGYANDRMAGGLVGLLQNDKAIVVKGTKVSGVTFSTEDASAFTTGGLIGPFDGNPVDKVTIYKDCEIAEPTGHVTSELFAYDTKLCYMDDSGETYVVKSAVAWTVVGGKETGFGSLQAAVNNADAGAEIFVLSDIELDATVNIIDKDIVVEGNGHTISGKGVPVTSATLSNGIVGFHVDGGNVSIQNMTLTGFDGVPTCNRGSVIQMGYTKATNLTAKNLTISQFARDAFSLYHGTFLVEDCVIDCAIADGRTALTKGFQVGTANNGTPVTGTIRKTKILNSNSTYDDWSSSGIEVYASSTIDVEDCEIAASPNGIYIDNYWAGYQGYAAGDVVVNVRNTTISDATFGIYISTRNDQTSTATVNVESGNFEGYTGYIYNSQAGQYVAPENATFNITGGTYQYAVPESACGEGFVSVKNDDGTYGVRQESKVASVNGSEDLMSLTAAFKFAKENANTVITLTDDVDLSYYETINMDGVAFTLDGNGKTITGLTQALIDSATTGGKTINIRDLTIRGATNAGLNSSHSGVVNAGALFNVVGYCDITLSKVKVVDSEIGGENTYYAGGLIGYVAATAESVLNVVDCSVTGTKLTSTSSVGGLFGHSNGGLTTITGTEVGGNTLKGGAEAKEGSLIGTLTACSGTEIDVVETAESSGSGTLNVIGRLYTGVTYTNGEYFTNPENASATNEGTAITVDGEIMTNAAGKFIIAKAKLGENFYATIQEAIDAATADANTIMVLGNVTESGIKVATDDVVVIDLNGKTVYGDFVVYGDATIKNGTIDSTSTGKSGIETNNEADRTKTPKLVTEELTIISGRHALRVDGGEVTVKSGSYTAADAASNHAVNISDGGKVTIDGGTFVGNTQSGTGAVAMRGETSELTINDGTFNGGSVGSLTVWGGDATVAGGTFDSVNADRPVTITGGTFNAINKLVSGGNITGGTFREDPSDYLGNGYVTIEQEDGTYKVEKATNWIQVADTSWYDAEATEFTLDTPEKLAGVAKLVNEGRDTFAGKKITLAGDMNLAGLVWPGIGIYKGNSFQGTFDGAAFKVSNMDLSDDSNGVDASEANNYRGFFNYIDNATITDVTVAGDVWKIAPASTEYGGALIVGHAKNSTIQNCVAEGTINGTHNVAGVVVRVEDSQLIACINKANVTGSYSKMGGIAALVQNSETFVLFDGCVNEGTITSTVRGEDGVGGIVGWVGYPNTANITVRNCENKGTITATETATVGQIAAESWNGNHVFMGNKGLPTMVATGHAAMDGLNFATVADGVATYVKTLEAGNTYLVTASGAKPVIALAAGELIVFDQTLATIDDSGITAATTLDTTTDGNLVTYKAKGYVVTITWPDGPTTDDDVALGETVTLTARTIEGVSFIGWSGDVVSAAETLSVTVEKSLAVTANYIPSELHTQMTNQVVVAYKDANELISIKDIQDMSLQNPTIEVGKDAEGNPIAEVGIQLMRATTLQGDNGHPNWTPVKKVDLLGAYMDEDGKTMKLQLPADKKAQFFRFVPKNGLLK